MGCGAGKSSRVSVADNTATSTATTVFAALPGAFSVCAGSLKLNGMRMSDAAVTHVAECLTSAGADVIAWLETDTRLDESAAWRRLAVQFQHAGYTCFLDGGVPASDGSPTPAMQMSAGDEDGGERYTALVVAVRTPMQHTCTVSATIARDGTVGKGSAKGFLRRALYIHGATLVVLATSLSPKSDLKNQQMALIGKMDAHREFAMQFRNEKSAVKEIGVSPSEHSESRYTYICLGDLNMRLVAKDGWISADPLLMTTNGQPANKLWPEAVNEVVRLLRSEAGRRELLQRDERNLKNHCWVDFFYDQTRWWLEGHGDVQLPTYKRTPYCQCFPRLTEGETKPEIRTTQELVELAEPHSSIRKELLALLEAEVHDFEGAEPALLKREFFGARDKAPKTKVLIDAAQTYLNEDANGDRKLMNLGWMDSVGFGRGHLSNFRQQVFRSFKVVPQIHAFDHLMTLGVMDFLP
eukprot:TRINITY_DN46574_c0_g1_i1.p1 TRINITY_DN46574_c0_g1~~TRINITY_DN46574_c0_g1_i1.p1  ORF type:complete len:467 (-),score=72.69 TRINITY_DN46574_c0_g1_i1:234-1634(-)